MKKKMEKERSDCTCLFSAVTDVRLQTGREREREREERQRDLRVVGEISPLMYVCRL